MPRCTISTWLHRWACEAPGCGRRVDKPHICDDDSGMPRAYCERCCPAKHRPEPVKATQPSEGGQR